MTTHQEITSRDPAELHIAPPVATLNQWPDEHPEFHALVEDIRQRGIDYPLLIDERGQIWDGRHRWRAARRLQLTSVPCRVCTGGLINIAQSSILQRRHYNKYQRAYLVVDLAAKSLAEATESGVFYFVENHEKRVPAPTVPDVATWAAMHGINKDYFYQATQLIELFSKFGEHKFAWGDDPEILSLREHAERSIFDDENPAALGPVKAGIMSKLEAEGILRPGKTQHGGGAPKEEPRQLTLFTQTFADFQKRYSYWTKFKGATRDAAVASVTKAMGAMPHDLRTTMVAASLAAMTDGELKAQRTAIGKLLKGRKRAAKGTR